MQKSHEAALLPNAQCLDLLHKRVAEDAITVAPQITRGAVSRKGLLQLLCGPLGRGMGRDAEVQNAPPVVCQHQKDVQDLKADRGHGKGVSVDLERIYTLRVIPFKI
jgi:hypothetical protein